MMYTIRIMYDMRLKSEPKAYTEKEVLDIFSNKDITFTGVQILLDLGLIEASIKVN